MNLENHSVNSLTVHILVKHRKWKILEYESLVKTGMQQFPHMV